MTSTDFTHRDWTLAKIDALLEAAEQGDNEAQVELAQRHEAGSGVEWSYSEALKWYFQAAKQGHVQAWKHIKKSILRNQHGEKLAIFEMAPWLFDTAEEGTVDARE